MNDQVSVCVGDCIADLQEQLQPRPNIKILFITPFIDRLALDVLEDELQHSQ